MISNSKLDTTDSCGLWLSSGQPDGVKDEAGTTLKAFIQIVGFLVFLLGIAALLILAFGLGRQTIRQGPSLGLILMGSLALALSGIMVFVGWRIFRNWDFRSVREYSWIQAAATGIAVGEVTNLFWPQFDYVHGFIVFIFATRVLEPFLLCYFGFSREHCWAKGFLREADGTPWQNNPGYTTR